MEICNVTPALLCISGGKCVCVEVRRRPSPSYLQLVTENRQVHREGLVQVYNILYEGRECMAFCFKLGDKAIFPFTDGEDVKFTEYPLQQKVTKETFNKNNLFQWGEAGSRVWRSLKSVAEPSMFLFIEDNENKVTIKPVEMPHFSIVKEKGSTRTSKLERCCIPKKLNKTTLYERVSLVSRDSNRGPSFCEATALSTKSACRHKSILHQAFMTHEIVRELILDEKKKHLNFIQRPNLSKNMQFDVAVDIVWPKRKPRRLRRS